MNKYTVKELAIKCIKKEFEFDHTTPTGERVYSVSTDELKVLFWNSSNNKVFDKEYACERIYQLFLEGELEGSFYDPNWSEIMYEVEEIF